MRSFTSFVTGALNRPLPTQEKISANVVNNQYVSPSNPPRFNYAGQCELIFDAHSAPLKPRGMRFLSSLYGLSLYSNYYYYSIAYNGLYLGLTAFSSTLLTMMLLNGAIFANMGVVEIIVLPTRDRVRFLFMGGMSFECNIADVQIIRVAGSRITFNAKTPDGKDHKVIVDTNHRNMHYEYLNPEFLIALGHPDVHKI